MGRLSQITRQTRAAEAIPNKSVGFARHPRHSVVRGASGIMGEPSVIFSVTLCNLGKL